MNDPIPKNAVEQDEIEEKSPSQNWEIVPGKSIGPVKIGMTREEIAALIVLKTHPKYAAMTTPISINYSHDRAQSIEISLKLSEKEIQIRDLKIPRNSTIEELQKLLGNCLKDDSHSMGGMMIQCGKGLSITIGSGDQGETGAEIWLRVDHP